MCKNSFSFLIQNFEYNGSKIGTWTCSVSSIPIVMAVAKIASGEPFSSLAEHFLTKTDNKQENKTSKAYSISSQVQVSLHFA